MATVIGNLIPDALEVEKYVDERNAYSFIYDFSQSLETRLRAWHILATHDMDMEIMRHLCALYFESRSAVVREFIFALLSMPDMSVQIALQAAIDLCADKPSLRNSISGPGEESVALEQILRRGLENNMSSSLVVQGCSALSCAHPKNVQVAVEILAMKMRDMDGALCLRNIVAFLRNCEQKITEDDRKNAHFFLLERFMEMPKDTRSKILAFQRACELCGASEVSHLNIFECISEIAHNAREDYNTRADAADALIKYGKDVYSRVGKSIIQELSGVRNENKNLYANAQNAHSQSIAESAMEIVRHLGDMQLVPSETYIDDIRSWISTCSSKDVDAARVEMALTRIQNDVSRYGSTSITLEGALALVHAYIGSATELRQRLLEELSESADICATGVLERIVNTLSGHGTFSLKISFEEQISGNFAARLTHRIKTLNLAPCLHTSHPDIFCRCARSVCNHWTTFAVAENRPKKCGKCTKCLDVSCLHPQTEKCQCNTDLADMLLEQLCVDSRIIADRLELRCFMRFVSQSITDELWAEFKEHLKRDVFDAHICSASVAYESNV